MSKSPKPQTDPVEPAVADSGRPAGQDPGTNRVEHEPNPAADPIEGGDGKYVKRSPFTTGND